MTRRRNRKKRQLQQLTGILGLILVGLMILVLALPKEPDDILQTDPPDRNTTGSTPPATQSTVPPTTEMTEPLRQGWVEDSDGRRYYYNQDGTPYSGWLQEEDGLYFLREDGSMARGEAEIDGKAHYFTSAGRHIYLVNPWNYVPEDYEVALKELPSSISVADKQVDVSCYDALVAMMTDCKKAGHQVCVVSAYRTQAYQERLFNNQVAKQMAALNCTREEAEKIAATISAIPGTSEHQLGLAVDIVDTQSWELSEIQETLAGQKWLMENSWRYGFILRYPNGTTSETGIIYEPWHYRYVGIEVATELYEQGVTLEAYLAALD